MNLYRASRGMRRNLRAGHAEALELAVVEAADDGLLADLADLGGFAGREHGLHTFVHPAGSAGSHEGGPRTAVRPSRRGPESVRESLSTGSLAPPATRVPRSGAGRGRWSGRLRRATELRASWRGSTTRPIVTGECPINAERIAGRVNRFRLGIRRIRTLAEITALAHPTHRFNRTLPACRLQHLADSVRPSSTTQPPQLHSFCHFPGSTVKIDLPETVGQSVSRSVAGTCHGRRDVGCRHRAPVPTRRGYSGYPAFPNAGGSPHNDSFQIKQQHCEVRRGDAADAACLAEAGRAEPASASPAPRPELRHRGVVEVRGDRACPPACWNRSTCAACRSM